MNNESSTKERGIRLKKLRNIAGLTRKQFEADYDISAATLRSWEEGRQTGLTERGAKRIVLVLRNLGVNVSIGWLLTGDGDPPKVNSMLANPELSTQTKEDSTESKDSIQYQDLESFSENHMDPIFAEIIDDSMNPIFEIGTIVAGNRYFDNDLKNAIEKNCIIELSNGEKLVRHVKSSSKDNCYTLISLNPYTSAKNAFISDTSIVSAAPIIITRAKTAK